MKVGVIGANGNVGSELCYLLKNDCDVIPIVRNRIGLVFLEYQGIKCRIGDLLNSENAKTVLEDIDVIVNAAWASDRFSGSQNQTSREINKKIIENCFKFSKGNVVIIYLSTIRAFSNKVDPTTSKYFPPRYDVEKQFLDKIMKKNAAKYKKKGISFRCGHVFGEGQPNTKVIRKQLSENQKFLVQAASNSPSNILHIVTLKDAIFKCLDNKINSGTYSLVNNPQWTWKNVFDFYNTNSEIKFSKPLIQKRRFMQKLYGMLKGKRKYLIPIIYYFPKRYEQRLIKEMSVRKYQSEISKLQLDNKIVNGNFGYVAIPGKQLSNLEKTNELLKNYNASIFKNQE